MKSRFLKACSMVIIMALMIQLLPLQAIALEASTGTTVLPVETITTPNEQISTEEITFEEPATILGEVTAKRTEFSKEYQLSNGLSLAVVYPEAVHYQKDGQWKDIDTTLTAKDGIYTTTASPMHVSFPQQLSKSNTITVELNGYTVSFGMAGELRGSADGKITTSQMGSISADLTVTEMQTSTAQLQTLDYSAEKAGTEYPETVPEKLKSRLVYSNVYSNTNVVYDLTGHKLKESVVIAHYDSALQGYRYTLNTGNLTPVLNEDNSISLMDPATKEAVLRMPAPYMIDNDGAISNDVQVALIPSGSSYTLLYRLPAQWMADEERSWPVVLDPEIEADDYSTNILDIFAAENWRLDRNHEFLYTGYHADYGAMRTYIKYVNLPNLSSADVIVNAKLTLWKCGGVGTAAIIETHKVLESWDPNSIVWSNQPDFDSTIADYAVVNGNGNYHWMITELVTDWYTDENYGLVLKSSNAIENGEAANWQGYYSIDYTTENNTIQPCLYITFRNVSGLESYWDYTTISGGRVGTGYVNNYSGNLVWVHNDIGFGGNRMPVSISHIYNSNNRTIDPYGLGAGWKTNYHQTVTAYGSDGEYYEWEDGDGTKHYFLKKSAGVYEDEDNLNLTLTVTSTGYTITDQVGNTSVFDTSGRLIKMQNNQQTSSSINITYVSTGNSKISRITDGVGRKYDFSYGDDGKLEKISYKGNGSTEISYVAFAYTGGNLYSITDKDGEQSKFSYSMTGNLLVRSENPDGHSFLYFYTATEPQRITTVLELGGSSYGASMSFAYAHNQTTITDHDGNATVMQFNDWGNTTSIQDREGRGQYFQYAVNRYNETGGTPNQLTLSSTLQTTVNNQLMFSSYENRNLWTANSDTITMERSPNLAYMGSYSLKVVSSVSNNSYGVYSEKVTVKPGETITFSAYVMAVGTPVQLAFHCNNYEGYNFIARGDEMQPTGYWERMEVSYTNTTEVTLKMVAYLFCKEPGTAYMDCVQAEIAPSPSRYNMLQNGDFTAIGYWSTSAGRTSLATGETTAAPNLNSYVYKFTGSPTTANSISQDVKVYGDAGDTFVLAGWAKGDSVPLTDNNRKFGLRVRIYYTEGASYSEEYVDFNTASGSANEWQMAAVSITARHPYNYITVYLEYGNNANTVYFDGIQLYRESFGEKYTYDANGNIKTVRDILGNITTYTYNDSNDVTQIEYPNGITITNEYSYHNPIATTQTYTNDQFVTSTIAKYLYSYDTYGNLIWQRSDVGSRIIETHSDYTNNGNYLEYTVDEFGKKTYYHYNPNTGVLEWVKYPNDTEATRTNYTYDAVNRLSGISVTTNQGKTLSVAYTFSDDRLTKLQTNSTAYDFTYNAFGDRTSVKIGTRSLATYTYTDDKNRYLSRLDYGNNDSVQYTYDDEGRVTKAQYENGYIITYAYDNTGALVKMNDSATNATRYYYDDLGRVGKLKESGINGTHIIAYTYDNLGSVRKIAENCSGTSYQTIFTYDGARRVSLIETDSSKESYIYDAYGRLDTSITHHKASNVVLLQKQMWYKAPNDQGTSNIPETIIEQSAGGYEANYTYGYDDNGNITSIKLNNNTTKYTYDSANQLIREDNQAEGKSWVWTYDDAGNILSKREYAYTTGTLGTAQSTIYYGYGNAQWGDLLTTYNGTPITYDTVGNPTYDGTWNYTWIHGRKLVTMYKNGTTCSFSYDANGMRNRRTVITSNGTTTYNYTYSGSQLTHMTIGGYTLHFYYDANGYPMSVVYNGTTYYYATNLQGDVVAILNSSGVQVVGYRYDAWGRLLTTTGSMSGSLGYHNPLRYRGYVYDQETQLYYLQSRYYNPTMGRFINADGVDYLGAGSNLTSYNLFAYCGNNPVAHVDYNGYFGVAIGIGFLAGLVGQYISDVIGNIQSGKTGAEIFIPTSYASDYLASGIGGAIAAIPGLNLIGTMAVGAVGSVVSDGLKGNINSWEDLGKSALKGGVANGIGYGVAKGMAALKVKQISNMPRSSRKVYLRDNFYCNSQVNANMNLQTFANSSMAVKIGIVETQLAIFRSGVYSTITSTFATLF